MAELTPISPADAGLLADLHAMAFDHAWSAVEFSALLNGAATGWRTADGFILVRQAAGEAEILTLAVAPAARRRGLGRALVNQALASLDHADLFLEVAADNAAAIALYEGAGFAAVGRRRGYYARPEGRADALVLRRGAAS